ncbi:MAG: FIST N-terminal domain-containing protein, partial [Bacteroidota bacterium]
MKIQQALKTANSDWKFTQKEEVNNPLVLIFGDRNLLEDGDVYEEVKAMYPKGNLVFGSTSGEILSTNVHENSITLTAIEFERTTYEVINRNVSDFENVQEMGKSITEEFDKKLLQHVFVVSDGSFVNGSGLIKGLENAKDFQ